MQAIDVIIEGQEDLPRCHTSTGPYSMYEAGSFAVVDQGLRWYGCRERFHHHVDFLCNWGSYFYAHIGCRLEDVANFIYLTEQRLGLKCKTSFGRTQRDGVCLVRIAPWWLDQPMRHQFFTIALRASLRWSWGGTLDYRKVLGDQLYAKKTPLAVDRFLAGYTSFTGARAQGQGWYNQFVVSTWFDSFCRSPSVAQIEAWLVKPLYDEGERAIFIEKAAYLRWEGAGRPQTDGRDFWKEAEREYRLVHQFRRG